LEVNKVIASKGQEYRMNPDFYDGFDELVTAAYDSSQKMAKVCQDLFSLILDDKKTKKLYLKFSNARNEKFHNEPSSDVVEVPNMEKIDVIKLTQGLLEALIVTLTLTFTLTLIGRLSKTTLISKTMSPTTRRRLSSATSASRPQSITSKLTRSSRRPTSRRRSRRTGRQSRRKS
jgi:hypothetical protein